MRSLFFFFGLCILAFAPRTPDLEKHLNLTNARYGFLVSLGSIGALFAFFFMGQLVHRVGAKSVILVSGTSLYLLMGIIPHIKNAAFFTLSNIVIAVAFNTYATAIHDHALARQSENPELMLPKLHGVWSVGALSTVVIAFAVTSSVSLAWHIDTLMTICFIGTVYSTLRIAPILVKGSHKSDPKSKLQVKEIWKIFNADRIIGIIYISSVMCEFSTNDWATLQAHQEIGASKTLSILPYLLFMVGMITGRLGLHIWLRKYTENFLIRLFTATGGLSFVLFTQLAAHLAKGHFAIAFASESLAFFMGGLGGSFMAGLVTQISNRRTDAPGALVFAHLQIVVGVTSMLIKFCITSVVNVSTITNALIIPGLLMFTVSLYPNLGAKTLQSSDEVH